MLANLKKEPLLHASSLQQSGNNAEAYEIYEKIFPRHKKNPDFLLRMAFAAISLGMNAKAKKLTEFVIKLEPNSGAAYNLLGAVSLKEIQKEKALRYFKRYVELEPANAKARLNLAKVFTELNRAEDAAKEYSKSSELDPTSALPYYWNAVTHRALGQLDKSAELFRKALALKPDYAGAWKQLAELKQLDLATDLPVMKTTLESLAANPREQAKIHFALAMVLDNNKEYKSAYTHLERGNETIRRTLNYNVADDEILVRDIATKFTRDLLGRFQSLGSISDKMIFIVGMPRSGTTLVEQVISGHSLVYAGGELPYVEDALKKLGNRNGPSYPASAEQWSKKDLKRIAEHYLKQVEVLNSTASYITDKLPNNFLNLGAIKAIFPKARILHCRRDPLDTCLGNYRQLFTKGQEFSYSQGDLVRYFKAYQSLMAHWHSLFGADILDISYEALVQNFSGEAKRIVTHCGLAWEDQCIDTQNAKRAVYTASASQIREGVHANYIKRWQNYQPYIGTLIKGLEGNGDLEGL